jgi:hypothetical protein
MTTDALNRMDMDAPVRLGVRHDLSSREGFEQATTSRFLFMSPRKTNDAVGQFVLVSCVGSTPETSIV